MKFEFFLFLFSRRVARGEWLDAIKKHQTLSENRHLYICDVHFDLNDICKRERNSTVRKGAVPKLEYVF